MEAIYRQEFNVTPALTDCFGRLKASGILYFAQEAAGGHCRLLQLDWDTLAKQDLFWAVLRYRVVVNRLPRVGETVTVETWPMPTTRVAFPRATVCLDSQGNELFCLVGLWVLMDRNSRTMVLPGKTNIALPGTVRGLEPALPTSIAPAQTKNSIHRTVAFSDLDRNGHMNNTRYMEWINDLLTGEFHRDHPVKEFTLCYLSEAREGEALQLAWELSEEGCLMVQTQRLGEGVSANHSRVFAAQVQYK
jgi:acyl-ACP thioesterase